ncbi:hypothetical protein JJB07_10425 [Tumebacillus sp. ITR2]|uniref:Type 4 fimbrial biogenesis protein PilX N-terminal domain-containing protein n=1 Tax=Tumebacillus amylolyticus TaxID=2801339 RepID=A0ABS1J9W5_9BACL|nr:hypothetical protein [Tumebacillus amylolyticus]MBL0387066.1 hypothetical protein [Tumebacillus amylolyticus]
MYRGWRSEEGSALLLVFLAVTVLGMMIGGVTLAVHNSANQSIVHEKEVQAEFHAEQSMELAVYMLYNQPEQFQATFRNATGTNCLTNPNDSEVNVCLESNTDADGYVWETLVARAKISGQDETANPLSAIRFQLTASEVPDPVNPAPGGGLTTNPTNPSTPTTPDPTPTPPSPTENPNPTNGLYLGEETCGVTNNYLMRALVIGNELDFGNAMLEDNRRALKNDNYAYKSDSVEISGGVYLDNDSDLVIARPKNNDKFDIYAIVNGWIRPEGGLSWSQGNGHQSDLAYSLMGANAKADACSRNVTFHTYMNQLGNKVYNSLQAVPVYYYRGTVTTRSTGTKKSAGTSTFQTSSQTLAQVLADKSDKIILINGTLQMDTATDSQGYLIVYNTANSNPATIKLPDNFVWSHSGAVTTEKIISTDSKKSGWPSNYRLYITLTQPQATLYDQDGR